MIKMGIGMVSKRDKGTATGWKQYSSKVLIQIFNDGLEHDEEQRSTRCAGADGCHRAMKGTLTTAGVATIIRANCSTAVRSG